MTMERVLHLHLMTVMVMRTVLMAVMKIIVVSRYRVLPHTLCLWSLKVSDISTATANKLIITPFGRAVAVYKASPLHVGLVNQQQHSKRCNNYYIHTL